MEPALKQRLLGAAVIVALAVIIIPFLLDGSGTEPVSEIPLPPESHAPQQGPVVSEQPVPAPAQAPQSQVIDQYTPPPSTPEPSTAPAPMQPQAQAPTAAEEPPAPAEPAPTPEPAPVQAPEPTPTPTPAQPAPPQARQAAPEPKPRAEASAPATAQPGAEAWVVQVGSFSQQDKASALRDRLRKQQFKAFVERFKAGNGQQLYRVRVGPVPERTEAEQLQQQLQAQANLKGFVTHQQ